jgi:hypothetical protein
MYFLKFLKINTNYNSLFSKIKRFTLRLMIYQIIFLWAFIRLNKIEQTSDEIKEKLKRNYNYFKIPNNPYILDFIEDPSIFVLIWSLMELIFGLLAIFGNIFANKFSAILFSISTIIYFNPFLPENRGLFLYDMRSELFYNTGIFLAILLCAYQPIPEYVEEENKEEIRFMIDHTRSNYKNTNNERNAKKINKNVNINTSNKQKKK